MYTSLHHTFNLKKIDLMLLLSKKKVFKIWKHKTQHWTLVCCWRWETTHLSHILIFSEPQNSTFFFACMYYHTSLQVSRKLVIIFNKKLFMLRILYKKAVITSTTHPSQFSVSPFFTFWAASCYFYFFLTCFISIPLLWILMTLVQSIWYGTGLFCDIRIIFRPKRRTENQVLFP